MLDSVRRVPFFCAAAFFRVDFLLAGFLADFLAVFLPAFLLRFLLLFLLAFLLAFLRADFLADFLAVFFADFLAFFFADFFFATFLLRALVAFFLVTLRFEAAVLRFVAFFAGALREARLAVFRFLLAVFFAGIVYSCGTEKRRGLYMAWAAVEARFRPVFHDLPGHCLFLATIVLWPQFHYTSATSGHPLQTPYVCDSAKSSSLASNRL
ncbi:MAG: hypothetical protein R3288_08760 [Woeseiaceae bacterium]|nr:hypothetical protein [Woeseiaceae bacterium]